MSDLQIEELRDAIQILICCTKDTDDPMRVRREDQTAAWRAISQFPRDSMPERFWQVAAEVAYRLPLDAESIPHALVKELRNFEIGLWQRIGQPNRFQAPLMVLPPAPRSKLDVKSWCGR